MTYGTTTYQERSVLSLFFPHTPFGHTPGSEALLAGFRAIPAGSEALPAGLEFLPAGSKAHPP